MLSAVAIAALIASPVRPLLAYDWRDKGPKVEHRKTSPEPASLVSTAREYLGTPYVWGGVDKSGFDCSGFVNWVYAQNGYDLPRCAREQIFVGDAVTPAQLRAGDLLFFAPEPGSAQVSHVAMYVGDDAFIHASQGKGEVAYDRLSTRYFNNRFVYNRCDA
jgi:cell wall-associated NlpC family hydrolase